MLKKPNHVFNNIFEAILRMDVIDTHEHLRGPERDFAEEFFEPIHYLSNFYLVSDLWSVGARDEEIDILLSKNATTDEKWPVFNRLWMATEHTAYSRVTKLLLRDQFGIETLDRQALDRIIEQRAGYKSSYYVELLKKAGIKAVIADVLYPGAEDRPIRYYTNPELIDFFEGKFPMPDIWHPAFSLPYFHEIRNREFINFVSGLANIDITSLDEFIGAVFELLRKSKDLGVVAIKDQSAYRRTISFDLPTHSDAERLFNNLLLNARNQLSWPEAKPLDDFLFHQYMRFARELDLPVQIHTGHMAGIRNRVDKANAANFAAVLELHTRVQFDLFHGNWPYMGDLLFLAKNYPNASINLCWVHMLDPIYSLELLKRATMTVPHSKIHGFGGDYKLFPEFSTSHLALAREVISAALTDLVECEWLEERQALQLAADWLFNNPNNFYNLGFPAYEI